MISTAPSQPHRARLAAGRIARRRTLPLALLAALVVGAPAARAEDTQALAAQAKEIFRSRCFECHGGRSTNDGVVILDRVTLVDQKKKVIPGQPDQSQVYQLITAKDEAEAMPPVGQPRLSQEEIDAVRGWILAGAPTFPADVVPAKAPEDNTSKDQAETEIVLRKILDHVRTLSGSERPFIRYFSINHLLASGATREELELHRLALVKAINHLSLEPRIVRPQTIDAPTNTVFAVDIRRLGWHKTAVEDSGDSKSKLNSFDLALLEYPYGILGQDSETFDRVMEEYVTPAGLARPIPFIRVDWFVSSAMQSPLYDDFLRLPVDLADLEREQGVDSEANLRDHVVKRAGMIVSGVSRSNRVVERHPARQGSYWKSFDFPTSKGRENMYQDPIHLHPAGGEMIFTLPNNLNGYFLATGAGRRLEVAPTSIVTDKFSEDKTVRNGLSCVRCHDQGFKTFEDTVRVALVKLPGSPGFSKRDALELYAPQKEMDSLLEEDIARFKKAMEEAIGARAEREPLTPVSHRFFDAPLQLRACSAELGLADSTGLERVFRSPQFAGLGLVALGSPGGMIRRDMWDDYYPVVVRDLGVGAPLPALDSLGRTDFPPDAAPFDVELSTNRKNNVFAPGDEAQIFVTNRSTQDLFIELIGTSPEGEKTILAPSKTQLKAGAKFQFPEKGGLKVQPGVGRESVTLFASTKEFPAGKLMRGKRVIDRVVHGFDQTEKDGAQLRPKFDTTKIVKRTVEIEVK